MCWEEFGYFNLYANCLDHVMPNRISQCRTPFSIEKLGNDIKTIEDEMRKKDIVQNLILQP